MCIHIRALGIGIMLTVVGLSACDKGGKSTTGPVAVNPTADQPKEVVFEVKGMTCSGCEQAITERLSGINGVVSVKADRHKERTWVTYQDHVASPDQLEKEINELGYEAHTLTEAAPTSKPTEP